MSCGAPAGEATLAPQALVRAGMAALGTRLGFAPAEDPAASAAQVREWLEHTERTWLIVFDDAADVSVLEGLIPQQGPGLVVVTSRNRRWENADAVLDVEVFDTPSAAGFLQARAGIDDAVGAGELADALGGLALALEQAAAFIAQSRPVGITFRSYLAELQRRGLAVFTGRVADYDLVVATVWDRSLEAVADRCPHAVELLEVLGAVAPAPLPVSVLRAAGDADAGWSPFALAEALAALGAYSLVDAAGDAVVMHRLVHRHIGESLATDPPRQAQARSRAAALLTAAFPSDSRLPESWPAATALLPHVTALVAGGLIDTGLTDARVTVNLTSQAGASLYWQGDLVGARTLQDEVLTAERDLLGPRHPDTLRSANNLAETMRAQGDLVGARTLQDEVHTAHRELLGPRHPDTLTSAGNLALTMQAQGDPVGARTLQDEVHTARRELLGPRHPDTLTSAGNLALTMQAQGDLVGARTLQDEVLTARRELLGPRHPATSVSAWNLYTTLRRSDRATARTIFAEELRWLLDANLKELGADLLLLRQYVSEEVAS